MSVWSGLQRVMVPTLLPDLQHTVELCIVLLHAGQGKGHMGNPAASLRVETVHGVPVLLYGLASLGLTTKEEKLLDQQYKVHTQRLLRLHQATPAPVVFLLAGCLLLLAHPASPQNVLLVRTALQTERWRHRQRPGSPCSQYLLLPLFIFLQVLVLEVERTAICSSPPCYLPLLLPNQAAGQVPPPRHLLTSIG